MSDWDADLYLRFKDARAAPFEDLLPLVPTRPGLRVLDLGCGAGELTERLADHLDDADVVGIDTSPAMLEKAAPRARPGLRFERRPIDALDGSFDVLFSNAAIHWLPDHRALLASLARHLAPGGRLVVQVPSNHRAFANRQREVVARLPPFAPHFEGWTLDWPVLELHEYGEVLHGLGATDVVAFEKLYPIVLPSSDHVLQWLGSTSLRPYLARLPEPLRDPYRAEIGRRLRDHWGAGPVYFPYRRICFGATLPK